MTTNTPLTQSGAYLSVGRTARRYSGACFVCVATTDMRRSINSGGLHYRLFAGMSIWLVHSARVLGACSLVLSIVIATIGSAIAFALRDGLGPDSGESYGVTALGRFAEGAWPFWIIAACVAIGGMSIMRQFKKHSA